jgi:hypothetical protein
VRWPPEPGEGPDRIGGSDRTGSIGGSDRIGSIGGSDRIGSGTLTAQAADECTEVLGDGVAEDPGPDLPFTSRSWVGEHAPFLAGAAVVLGVVAVVLWQLDAPLLFTATTTTGGDTGAHFMMPSLFNSTLFPHLTGWDPGWYDGYPAYTFYFVLPDVLVAVAAHVISYDVAFKLATVLGSVLLPVCAWAAGRLFGLREPVPAALAAATLPFLFDSTWTIYGGNLFSTLAGEYPYSLSVALLVLFLGLFARGVRTGRHRGWAAVVLAACLLAHVVPGALAIVGAAALTLVELAPNPLRLGDEAEAVDRGPVLTRVWWAVSTVGLGLLLAAWWLVPFLAQTAYSTSMNYTKVTTYAAIFFPKADLWALVLSAVALVAAVALRSRFGLVVALLGAASAIAVVADPLRSLYNVRFLPLWFLFVYLMVGWLAGVTVQRAARRWRRMRISRWVLRSSGRPPGSLRPPALAPWAPGAVGGALLTLLAALAVVVPPLVPALAADLPKIGVQPGANEVSVWSRWNYTGYEGKPAYPEYRALMELMTHLGHRYGCGRAMWEYNADENRFGTPEALMLLPYWTHGCIDSMEGLLFESSATTPYHFLNQAELSQSPSEPVVGLPYGQLTVPLGVEHLQLLGVRYFMAVSPSVQHEAAVDPTLRLLATTGPWRSTYQGQPLSETWQVYEVAHAPLVEPLAEDPAVLTGVGPGQTTWLGKIGPGATMSEGPSLRWYLDPGDWATELAAGGPPGWPRTGPARATDPPAVPVPPTSVTHVRVRPESVSFDVAALHRPVLVKVSYFPNWRATGALGPWRATPNLMVVVPTRHHVVLTYGTAGVTEAGDAGSLLGVALLVLLLGALGWRRWRTARIG